MPSSLQREETIREQTPAVTSSLSPVGLPDVNGFLVYVLVFEGLLIQEVEKVFNCRRDGGTRTEHTAKEIIHELLQRSLKTHTDTKTR